MMTNMDQFHREHPFGFAIYRTLRVALFGALVASVVGLGGYLIYIVHQAWPNSLGVSGLAALFSLIFAGIGLLTRRQD